MKLLKDLFHAQWKKKTVFIVIGVAWALAIISLAVMFVVVR